MADVRLIGRAVDSAVKENRRAGGWQAECAAINRQKARRLKWQNWRKRGLLVAGFTSTAYFALAVWWLWQGGQLQRGTEAVSIWAQQQMTHLGFSVRRVEIHGVEQLTADEIMQSAKLSVGEPILLLSLSGLSERIAKHPQIQDVHIERALPDRLIITVSEREPAAIWQADGQQRFIDREGVVLKEEWFNAAKAGHTYPVITGKHAPSQMQQFWKISESSPVLKSNIVAAKLIGDRRWDIWLTGGLKVRLPMKNPEKHWRQLARLMQEYKITERAIAAIDLRVEGKIFVTFTPDSEPTEQDKTRGLVTAFLRAQQEEAHAAF